MQYQKYATRLRHLEEKIKNEDTVSPIQLAKDLGISKRMVFHYIEYLSSEIEKPIEYCRRSKTYKFK